MGDVGISVVRKEHSQPHFAELRGVQVIGQLEAVPQILRGDFDCRLADRVGDLWYRVSVRLDDEEPRFGSSAAKLKCQGERRDAPSDDGYIVIRLGVALHKTHFDLLRQRRPRPRAQL